MSIIYIQLTYATIVVSYNFPFIPSIMELHSRKFEVSGEVPTQNLESLIDINRVSGL